MKWLQRAEATVTMTAAIKALPKLVTLISSQVKAPKKTSQ